MQKFILEAMCKNLSKLRKRKKICVCVVFYLPAGDDLRFAGDGLRSEDGDEDLWISE